MLETNISWITPVLQVLIAGGLINVWILRFSHTTKYRGAGAHNMKEEFSAYGLPEWSMYVVGTLKIAIAFVMVLVLFQSVLMKTLGVPALGILAALMVGAISMHIKVKDTFIKSIPAILMLVMSLTALYMVNI